MGHSIGRAGNQIISKLTTEQGLPESERMDRMDTLGIVTLMNQADFTVPRAISAILPEIAQAVDLIVGALSDGGRLFYVGAGTSGRLGFLDAAECPPTFGTPPSMVQARIAGGARAVFQAVESAEDKEQQGALDLKTAKLSSQDVLVGIAASGRTPYVQGALRYAKQVQAKTIALSCNRGAVISKEADIALEVDTGPEVIMGSTRLKAGSAQKMVLNMLSSAAMIRMGKVYRNYMVDLKATNAKLVERSKRIIMGTTHVSYEEAKHALQVAHGHVKTAIVMVKTGTDKAAAERLLAEANGFVHIALGEEA